MDAALVTVSYRGDLELARDLCASVDAYVAPAIEHVLIVPRRDQALFAPLAGGRRRLLCQEDVLPPSFHRLPLPHRISLPFYSRRLRDIWTTPAGLVRCWILQQIVKLSADAATSREIIVFADSDVVFVRPLTTELLVRGDKVRLYHRPGETKDSPSHVAWHDEAARLLGLPPRGYFGADYIGQLITWRRSVLQKLHARIAEVSKRDWRLKLASSQALSEYVLYGVFAEHVLGAQSGHFLDTEDLTHASWRYGGGTPDLDRFVADFGKSHVAVLIQSTTDLPLAERRALIERMTNQLKQVA